MLPPISVSPAPARFGMALPDEYRQRARAYAALDDARYAQIKARADRYEQAMMGRLDALGRQFRGEGSISKRTPEGIFRNLNQLILDFGKAKRRHRENKEKLPPSVISHSSYVWDLAFINLTEAALARGEEWAAQLPPERARKVFDHLDKGKDPVHPKLAEALDRRIREGLTPEEKKAWERAMAEINAADARKARP